MKYFVLFVCILFAGCATRPGGPTLAEAFRKGSEERQLKQAEKERQQALEQRQRAQELASESEYECIQRHWNEIDKKFVWGESLNQRQARINNSRRDAAYLCAIKAKSR